MLVPLKLVKSPPINIFSSVCIADAYIIPLAPLPILKVLSISPFGYNLAIFLLIVPLYFAKEPTIKIFPSL